MPVLGPLVKIYYIRDLEAEVILKCENRTTDTLRADAWLKAALLEIAGNPEYRDSFDELDVWGPLFNLTGAATVASGAVQEYPFNSLITPGDYNLKTLDIIVWTDYPTNTIRKKLRRTTYQDTDRFLQTASIPVEWYRFGNYVGFNPLPNQNYQVRARIMRRHPIYPVIRDTPILLPHEWNEILEWAAVIRGYMEGLEFEKAQAVRTMLYGDPKDPEKPGLIKSVKTRLESERWLEEQPLKVVKGHYGRGF